jgi:hypothetical protein
LPGVTPVGTTALGLALVLLDLRLQGLDVLADPLGWLVVVVGLSRLAAQDRRFAWARWSAVPAGLLSVADLVHPSVTAEGSTRHVAPGGLQGLLAEASSLLSLAVAVLLSLAVRDAARRHDDAHLARRFSGFLVWHCVVGGVTFVAGLAGMLVDGREVQVNGAVAGPLVLLVIAVLAVEVWFLVSLARAGQRTWLGGRLEPAS